MTVPLDLAPVTEIAERLRYIAAREGKPLGHIVDTTPFTTSTRCPAA